MCLLKQEREHILKILRHQFHHFHLVAQFCLRILLGGMVGKLDVSTVALGAHGLRPTEDFDYLPGVGAVNDALKAETIEGFDPGNVLVLLKTEDLDTGLAVALGAIVNVDVFTNSARDALESGVGVRVWRGQPLSASKKGSKSARSSRKLTVETNNDFQRHGEDRGR